MTDTAQMILFALGLDVLGIMTFKKYADRLQSPAGRRVMAWALLILAGLTEIIWLVALKNSNGFADTWQGVISISLSWLSFFLLAYALKFIPAGTAYAVWTGCGAAGGAIAGMLLFGEGRTALRIGSIALIVIGILGVKLGDSLATSSDVAR